MHIVHLSFGPHHFKAPWRFVAPGVSGGGPDRDAASAGTAERCRYHLVRSASSRGLQKTFQEEMTASS